MSPILLGSFAIIIIILLLLDLGVFHKNSHEVSLKESMIWSVVWIGLSMIFSLFVLYNNGKVSFFEFQSAYWIEKSLSVDNLFVFILIFSQFKIPKESQHNVLYYGILGAIIFRAIFIFLGIELVNLTYLPEFDWWIFKNVEVNAVLFLFGIFLTVAGIKAIMAKENEDNDSEQSSKLIKLTRKVFKTVNQFNGNKFFIKRNGIRYATPLFTALIVIELSDLLFAVDSIPAIFSVSKDPFILYTSNIFAIMGLRSLYFVLANFIQKFKKLHMSVSLILFFIGIKMLLEPIFKIESGFSLIVIMSLLIGGVLFSKPWQKTPSDT